jgi:hypothetical protein
MALYSRVIAPKVAAGFAAALVISMSSGSRFRVAGVRVDVESELNARAP